jgi:hypothetical protein
MANNIYRHRAADTPTIFELNLESHPVSFFVGVNFRDVARSTNDFSRLGDGSLNILRGDRATIAALHDYVVRDIWRCGRNCPDYGVVSGIHVGSRVEVSSGNSVSQMGVGNEHLGASPYAMEPKDSH